MSRLLYLGETTIKLSVVLSLAISLCIMSLFASGLERNVHVKLVFGRTENTPGDMNQPPTVTKSMAFQWPSSANWVKVRIEDPPEDLQQQPVVAESWAPEWFSSISLRSPHGRVRVRMGVAPEGMKQPPVVAESFVSKWSTNIGLHSLHHWIMVQMGIVPEGMKQPPVVTETWVSDLPYPLGQLWDCLAQVDRSWLLHWHWQTMYLLCIAWIAGGLWRQMRRPQGKGRGQPAPSSMGTDRTPEATDWKSELCCRVDNNITVMERNLCLAKRLRLKSIWHQYYQKTAPVEIQLEHEPGGLAI